MSNDDSLVILMLKCCWCDARFTVEAPHAGYMAWQAGELIQNAMPEMTVDDRERLVTGVCTDCTDDLYRMCPE